MPKVYGTIVYELMQVIINPRDPEHPGLIRYDEYLTLRQALAMGKKELGDAEWVVLEKRVIFSSKDRS